MRTRSKRGFSFLEVLFSLMIVFFLFVIIGSTMPISAASRSKTDMNQKAMSLLQKQMEAVKAVGYPNLTPTQLFTAGLIDATAPVATNTYSFTAVDNARVDSPAQVLPTGVGRMIIEQVDLDLRRVTLTVTWTDRGRNRSMTVGTLVANL